MKKTILLSLAILAVSTVGADANDVKFYTDDKGQVFTMPAEGRVELKTKETPLYTKSEKLEFSGTHYLGYTYKNNEKSHSESNFELRRNYVGVKAYLLEDKNSYFRVTLDATYTKKTADNIRDKENTHADFYAKYAYLYLDDILPFTGVEMGMVHRPWIDYEEHQGWWMRSLSSVFAEAGEAAHLTNSADLGVNFKTKSEYFTSEIGLFNGEGYHGSSGENTSVGKGNSLEWRLSGAFFANGKTKRNPTKDDYFDASFFGQLNMDNSKNEVSVNGVKKAYNYNILGLHSVYNMPSFLLAAQYIKAQNDGAKEGSGTSEFNGEGYSINTTLRFGDAKEFSLIARYDRWEAKQEVLSEKYKTDNAIYGVAWQQNTNIKWLLSGQSYRAKSNKDFKGKPTQDWDSFMMTAEVHW